MSTAIQTISFADITDKVYGDDAFELTATATSGLDVSFEIVSGPATITGKDLSLTGVGIVVVKATQVGNDAFEAAVSVDQSFVVSKASQTVTFAELSDKTYGDAPFELVGNSSSDLVVSYELVSGSATITGNELTIIGAGAVSVKAVQLGNANYEAAESVIRTFTVSKASQTITFAEFSDKTYGDAPFELVGSASSELGISFELVSGPASLSEKTLSITGAGDIVIKASQSGDENILSAEQIRTLVVLKADQTITFDPIEDYLFGEGSVNLVASSSSLLAVEFEIIEGMGEIDAGLFTPTEIGQFTVRAYQDGNEDYKASDATQSFLVDRATGIEDVFVEEIQVYPNPATDFIMIDFPDSELKHIKVLNIKGQLIKTTQAHQSLRLNVQDLKVGMYFISIQTDEYVVTKRFLKLNN